MSSSCKGRFAVFTVLLQQVFVAAWPTTLVDTSGAGSLSPECSLMKVDFDMHIFVDTPGICILVVEYIVSPRVAVVRRSIFERYEQNPMAGCECPGENALELSSNVPGDVSKEQYLKVEIHDFHDHPEFSVTLRQLNGECGVYEWDLKTWTGTFEKSTRAGVAFGERSQLNLWVCAPFGEYELELESDSYSEGKDAGGRHTAWQILNGDDEFPVWDTLYSRITNDERYSPRTAGVYTWPFEGAEGNLRKLYVGWRDSRPCDNHMPPGVAYEGCFARASSAKASFTEGVYQRPMRDGYGMNVECSCGTKSDFESVSDSDQCGASSDFICTGDSQMICGGFQAMSVYRHEDERFSEPSAPQSEG